MFNNYISYPPINSSQTPMYNPYGFSNPEWNNMPMHSPGHWNGHMKPEDYGPRPFVVNIRDAAIVNNNFRTALWTGNHLQLTLMSINPGEDIGLEIHPEIDQFIGIEEGQGMTMMGDRKDNLYFQKIIYDNYGIFVPAGTWHNIINTGCIPLKLFSVYAPPAHPHGTVHVTKQDAEHAEQYQGY